MFIVRFMTLSGKFAPLKEEKFATLAECLVAVEAHAVTGGYTHVKSVEDIDSIRYTARTPGGRGGRNIAFVDYTWE